MSKLINKIIYPATAIILGNLVLIFGGKRYGENWKSWYYSIPNWILWTIASILAFWLIVALIRQRIKKIRRENHPSVPFAVFGSPVYGYSIIGTLSYKDVLWRIKHPNSDAFGLINESMINPNSIEISMPPYCPNCETTELNQHKNFWGFYIWSCIKCEFRKRNNLSFFREEDNILKLAKSEIELQKRKKK